MREHHADILTPNASGGRLQRISTYPCDRVCAARDCATVLSTYNPEPHCALHAPAPAPARRRSRELPRFERTCDGCGRVFETNNVRRRFCRDHCRLTAFQDRRRDVASATTCAQQLVSRRKS